MHVSPFSIAIIVTFIILLPELLAAFFNWTGKVWSEWYGKHKAAAQSKSIHPEESCTRVSF